MGKKSLLAVVLTLLLTSCAQPAVSATSKTTPTAATMLSEKDEQVLAPFEAQLEDLRQQLKIPGMSAAVVQDQQLVWAKGFGYADLENQVAATPDTPYGLASVTKPIAAVLIMQLAEEGIIDLDAPISRYGVDVESEGVVTVRHLLTHTSEGVPGTAHHYDGSRYARLGGVMEGAGGRTFARLLSERLLVSLAMDNTALNPINNWYTPSLKGLEDFKRILGWGKGFDHYPDVYLRLARPYQFGDQYEIIEGMYHLYHNPGAGLVSSVTDIARFDIALDQGRLLGDTAKERMFAPAYSVYGTRSDLNYGLGWYVQDFEGLRLLWHTGRWPPSTSALYLKVPDEELTFIVLANTDNLTTPFYGLGNGDVSQSTLALAFLRHFIFPRQHGFALPIVDWQSSESSLSEQLSRVQDEASRVFLERELWSYRQAYASVGRQDMVERLMRVNIRTFPQSAFRGDVLFTSTTGKFSVVSPVPSAASFVWLSRGIALWGLMVLVSLVWMVIRLIGKKGASAWQWAIWLLATWVFGPLSPWTHALASQKQGDSPLPPWKRAAGAALFCMSGYTFAWALAIAMLIGLQRELHPLLILGVSYLTPLLIGLLFVRGPLLLHQGSRGYGRALSRGFLTEIIALNLGFAVLFPLTMYIQQHLFSMMPSPTSPFFWGMMWFIAVVGLLVLFPLYYWMGQRGCQIWFEDTTAGQRIGGRGLAVPTLRDSWGALLATLGFMIVMLALIISQQA